MQAVEKVGLPLFDKLSAPGGLFRRGRFLFSRSGRARFYNSFTEYRGQDKNGQVFGKNGMGKRGNADCNFSKGWV